MTLFLVMVALLAAVSFPQNSPLPPGGEAAFMSSDIVEADCRERFEPDSALEDTGKSRTVNFRVFGQSVCHRPVFTASEREVFIETAVRSESSKAKQIALKVRSLRKHEAKPLGVQVTGVEEPQLRAALEALYRNELVAILGAGEVRKTDPSELPSETEAPLLRVRIRRVDAPELISKVILVTDDGRGEVRWQEL